MVDGNGGAGASGSQSQPPPPLAALFLIKFDLKVGYTISWKQSLPNVPLEGVVEYKSLPSGLHNVKEDLVYFVHEQWAGVSAFRNAEADAGERGARFISVGALVRLGDGRLGRAWEHAGALRDLAARLVVDTSEVASLEAYWDAHKSGEEEEEDAGAEEPESPYTVAHRRSRALSSLTTLAGPSGLRQRLPEYHPAYSILGYLDTFGPLVFPLHRMALLRKRVLVVTPAPVRAPCEYVYDLSILSSLPHSLSYSPPAASLTRLRPLFNLGIHDIPYLTTLSKFSTQSNGTPSEIEDQFAQESSGWIASTTDEILAMKPDLYDVLVELPQHDRFKTATAPSLGPGRRPKNKGVGAHRYPVLKLSTSAEEIKATQRDLRRYRSLRRALAPLTKLGRKTPSSARHENGDADGNDDDDAEDDEETHLLFNSVHENFTDEGEEELQHRQDEEKVTERPSWSELAYSSFMWWASAGEREEGLKAEDDLDAGLLGNLPEIVQREADRRGYHDSDDYDDDSTLADGSHEKSAEIEMAIIAYFHRVSKALFENAEALLEPEARPAGRVADSEAIDEDDDNSDDGGSGAVKFESSDLRGCGLDVWSERDRRFIVDFVDLWFEREVEVRSTGVECCGMRIC